MFSISTMTNQTSHNKRLESASSPAQIRTLPRLLDISPRTGALQCATTMRKQRMLGAIAA